MSGSGRISFRTRGLTSQFKGSDSLGMRERVRKRRHVSKGERFYIDEEGGEPVGIIC